MGETNCNEDKKMNWNKKNDYQNKAGSSRSAEAEAQLEMKV